MKRRADEMGTGIIPDVLRLKIHVVFGKHSGARGRRFGICTFMICVPCLIGWADRIGLVFVFWFWFWS